MLHDDCELRVYGHSLSLEPTQLSQAVWRCSGNHHRARGADPLLLCATFTHKSKLNFVDPAVNVGSVGILKGTYKGVPLMRRCPVGSCGVLCVYVITAEERKHRGTYLTLTGMW